MLTDEYHEHLMGRLPDLPIARRIVYSIMADLNDRSGMGWDGVGYEDREEILRTLIDIAEKELAKT